MTDRLLDVNLLLALADPRHVHHNAAHQWFADVICFATTPLTEVAFVRLMSHPRVGGETPATALSPLQGIRALDTHRFVKSRRTSGSLCRECAARPHRARPADI